MRGGMNVDVYKISLMDAYLIETLRSNGITNREILSGLEAGNVEEWQILHESFDFSELLKLANKDFEQFREIINYGYQVKFITFNGLKNLLRIRFSKEPDKDYVMQEKGIKNLVLNQKELQSVKQMLSKNWVLEEVKEDKCNKVNIQ